MQNYKPGANITIDEQLFPSKTRCKFTQYMPNKPVKFGLKFCDGLVSKYMLNAFFYSGKNESRPADLTLGEHAVLCLLQTYTKTGRNVTTNNFFTSLHLATLLKPQDISIVGIMKLIRKAILKVIFMRAPVQFGELLVLIHNNNNSGKNCKLLDHSIGDCKKIMV